MPAERQDPTSLDALAELLNRSGNAALDACDELLAHYSDTGDTPSQRAVDAMIDQAVEALRGHANSLLARAGDISSALEHRA